MKTTPTRPILLALALAAVFALPAQAAKTAELISAASLASVHNADGSANNNAFGGGGNGLPDLFDGKTNVTAGVDVGGNCTFLPRLGSNGYILLDFTSVASDGYYITDIAIYQGNAFQYSLYCSDDGENWDAVDGAVAVSKVGCGTYGVNKTASYIKVLLNQTGGWTMNLAEIQVFGYELAKPQIVSAASLASVHNADGSLNNNAFGGGGNGLPDLFDGKTNVTAGVDVGGHCTFLPRLGSNGYILLDFTSVSSRGYYVTDISIYQGNAFQYSLYYSNDGENWDAVGGAVAVSKVGCGTYGVNKTASYVKVLLNQTGGWTMNLAEIQVWGVDPEDIACLHPNIESVPWTIFQAETCLENGWEERYCPDCGTRFVRENTDTHTRLGHDYVTTLTKPGSASSCGSGTITCSRCDYEIDFENVSLDLMQFGGVVTENVIQFSNLSVSSLGNEDWGVSAARLVDNKWTFDEWRDWHAVSRSHDEFIQIEFGTTVDLTKIEFAVANHNQTVEFWNCDGAEEVKMGEVAVKTDSSVGEFIAQRKTIYFTGDDQTTGQAVKKLRVRFTDTEGLGVNGTRPVSMGEIHPYGTVVGAGKLDPGPPMFILMQ